MAIESLIDRIDAELAAADERAQQLKSQQAEAYLGRQQRLEEFGHTVERLSAIWRPRLEALAQKFGERVDTHPVVEPSRRSCLFAFRSELAKIDLTFSVAPDPDVRNLIVSYDLKILPILMKFDSHSEVDFPLDAVDEDALASWIEDRIVGFVQTYVALHENNYYLKDHMVVDPVAKVSFPKYAAAATLNVGGETFYFIDESTRSEFEQQSAVK